MVGFEPDSEEAFVSETGEQELLLFDAQSEKLWISHSTIDDVI